MRTCWLAGLSRRRHRYARAAELAPPSRAGRHWGDDLARGRAVAHTAQDHRSFPHRGAADGQRGLLGLRRLQRRDLQPSRACGESSKVEGTSSGEPRTPKSSLISTRSTVSDLFSRLRGMFTVAIYDVEERRLLLGRDRFGIKPLFYAHTPSGPRVRQRVERASAPPRCRYARPIDRRSRIMRRSSTFPRPVRSSAESALWSRARCWRPSSTAPASSRSRRARTSAGTSLPGPSSRSRRPSTRPTSSWRTLSHVSWKATSRSGLCSAEGSIPHW